MESTLSPGDAPVPELTAQQREFVSYLLTIDRGGQIAAMAYELGRAEALGSPRRPGKRQRHLQAVS